jgi:hypothetical protein
LAFLILAIGSRREPPYQYGGTAPISKGIEDENPDGAAAHQNQGEKKTALIVTKAVRF